MRERFLSDASAAFARNRPTLEALSGRYRLGIVSNFYGNLEAVCESAGIAPLFGVMADSHRVGAEKPDPALFRFALDALGASPETTIFVGDSLRRDGEGARRAGLSFVLMAPRGAETAAVTSPPVAATVAELPQLLDLHEMIDHLRGGIIAAGQGARLRADGYSMSKAMTPVSGRPLIAHALERFEAAGFRAVTIIVNEESGDCREWLARTTLGLDIDLIVRTTPSSYASFAIVADRLAGARALITTVDSILPVEDFCRFARSAAAFPDDAAVLGVTTHVDDEKPLWATLDSQSRIHALGAEGGTHVTAGLYWLPALRPVAPPSGFARLARLSEMAERTSAGLWRPPAARL